MKVHRISHRLYKAKIPVLPRLFRFLIFLLYNSDIPSSVRIGKGTVFGHSGIGVVIHQDAVIGENCVIGQGITIGGRSKNPKVPVIGNHVYIAAGARVLGPIKVGNQVVIAPNAVVIKDVADHSIVGGIPAKILREGINMQDFV
ncbi:MAG: serine O-acetyltransferase [Saprospiraceae bacterium]